LLAGGVALYVPELFDGGVVLYVPELAGGGTDRCVLFVDGFEFPFPDAVVGR